MAKDKKPAKIASEIFHNIMKASVSGKPTQPWEIASYINKEVEKVAPDWGDYLVLTVSSGNQLYYNIRSSCPKEKSETMEKVIRDNAAQFNLSIIDESE